MADHRPAKGGERFLGDLDGAGNEELVVRHHAHLSTATGCRPTASQLTGFAAFAATGFVLQFVDLLRGLGFR